MIAQGEADAKSVIDAGAEMSKKVALEYYHMLNARETNGMHYADYFQTRVNQLIAEAVREEVE